MSSEEFDQHSKSRHSTIELSFPCTIRDVTMSMECCALGVRAMSKHTHTNRIGILDLSAIILSSFIHLTGCL